MGTHPIFVSDFDCLTDMGSYGYISDMGSIADKIDIKVYKKGNKNADETIETEEGESKDTKSPPKTTKAKSKTEKKIAKEAESEYQGIYDYYSNIDDKIQIKVYKDQQPTNFDGDEMNSISYNPSYNANNAYSIGDSQDGQYSDIYSYASVMDESDTGGMFSNLEVHHWGMGIAGVATIMVALVYFLVFRKNAKFSHMMPRGRKKVSYDELTDEDDES